MLSYRQKYHCCHCTKHAGLDGRCALFTYRPAAKTRTGRCQYGLVYELKEGCTEYSVNRINSSV